MIFIDMQINCLQWGVYWFPFSNVEESSFALILYIHFSISGLKMWFWIVLLTGYNTYWFPLLIVKEKNLEHMAFKKNGIMQYIFCWD